LLHHGHAIIEIKSVEPAARRISGIATTPTPDRAGDVIDPFGATFTNPIPLLLHHDKERPIGTVRLHPATAAGIAFDATIPTIDEPGPLRDRVDEAWQSIKAGLLTGVSIGYRILNGGIKRLASGGAHFSATEICELSLVTVPANMHATIQTVKSLDAPYLAAFGYTSSGDPDPRSIARAGTKAAHPMTTHEQIQQFENTRAAKVARMAAIMETAGNDAATLDAAQTEEYDGLSIDVKTLDGHITRARDLEKFQTANATRITSPNGGTPAGSDPVVRVKSQLPPGTAFTRAAMAILATHGNRMEAVEYAKRWDRETPEVGLFLKAAVAPGDTVNPAWAGALVASQNIASEFLELLRPATILGKIGGLRRVPFNASVPVQTAGGSYGWVGQAAPKPVTKLGFGTAKLDMSKAAGIIILTEELVRSSSPSAEAIVRADMIAGIAQFLDQQFIDPAVGPVANVHPASITNGLTAIPSTGDPTADFMALLSAMTAANIPLSGVTVILSETNALGLSFQKDANGVRTFPNVGINGGSVNGLQIITSNTANGWVIALQPSAVLYADDGGVSIDVSREASVQMDSAPMNPADATTVYVSLWQNNLVGLRAERFINWKRGRDEGVGIVTGADYTVIAAPA